MYLFLCKRIYTHTKEKRKKKHKLLKRNKINKSNTDSSLIIIITYPPNHDPILDLIFCVHISQSSMTRWIHPGDLILRRYPQQFHFMQNKKQSSHHHTNPTRYHQNLNDVCCKQPSSSSISNPYGLFGFRQCTFYPQIIQ